MDAHGVEARGRTSEHYFMPDIASANGEAITGRHQCHHKVAAVEEGYVSL